MSAPSPTPISAFTPAMLLPDSPEDVNFAYSFSATVVLSIRTVLVSSIPKVRESCLLLRSVSIVIASLLKLTVVSLAPIIQNDVGDPVLGVNKTLTPPVSVVNSWVYVVLLSVHGTLTTNC